jgi:uncharacterized FAD-dependent dehydrogenase
MDRPASTDFATDKSYNRAMLEIRDIRLGLDEPLEAIEDKLKALLPGADFSYEIKKESLDARRRQGQLTFLYQVYVTLDPVAEKKEASFINHVNIFPGPEEESNIVPGKEALGAGIRPIVVGFGPAGIFAAYLLAQYGYRPIVLERGQTVEERKISIEQFWEGGPLNTESNVQFGEGGAGSFSDGKLTSRSKDPWTAMVKKIFIKHGAPEDILYSHESHIGTDLLRDVIRSMREQIIAWGGDVHFNTKVEDMAFPPDIKGPYPVVRTQKDAWQGPVFLAIGHSARDSFRMLVERGLEAEAKAFAVGFRVEHKQSFVDRARYGKDAGHPRLGPASYKLATRANKEGRNLYSFCMCPGGFVINASSGPESLVTNGMSYHARDGQYANSALLTSIKPGRDYGSGILDGVFYQENIEHRAWLLGGADNYAPAQGVLDYIQAVREGAAKARRMHIKAEATSFRPGVRTEDLSGIYSAAINRAICDGLGDMDRKMHGFISPEAHFIGVETRSSSPIRFLRDRASYMATGHPYLYPIGEGAGYAGGIISAGLDGLHAARTFMENFKPVER